MKFFIKIIFFQIFIFSSLVNMVSAQGFLGFKDPTGCQSNDPFLPTLVICGRSPATGACAAYTKPCGFSDFIETGRRILIWIISIVLMVIPVVIAYYGAMFIIYRENNSGGELLKNLKERILWLIIYFVCLLGAWIIVRTIVDIAQVNPRINTFLIENGQQVKAREFDFSR